MASETLTDHDRIRSWAEKKGGRPFKVTNTAGEEGQGIIRLDFGAQDEGLERIDWDEWFGIFEDRNLALIIEPDGNFNKLVSR